MVFLDAICRLKIRDVKYQKILFYLSNVNLSHRHRVYLLYFSGIDFKCTFSICVNVKVTSNVEEINLIVLLSVFLYCYVR